MMLISVPVSSERDFFPFMAYIQLCVIFKIINNMPWSIRVTGILKNKQVTQIEKKTLDFGFCF